MEKFLVTITWGNEDGESGIDSFFWVIANTELEAEQKALEEWQKDEFEENKEDYDDTQTWEDVETDWISFHSTKEENFLKIRTIE